MIKLIDCSARYTSNYIYTDHFPGQNRNLLLLMRHYNEDPYIELVLEKVLSEIVQLDLENIREGEICQVLQEFFVELNWRLFSLFSQRPDLERGISLFLGVMEANTLYAIQFGRYFMGVVQEKEFLEQGRKWEDLRVKSVDDLNLLGSKDTDIRVKIEKITFPQNSYFVVLESAVALDLQKKGLHYLSVVEHLNQAKEEREFSFALVKNYKQAAHNLNPWIRKKRVTQTALILLCIIIISSFYVYFGGNFIDDIFSRLRFRKTDFTRNEIKEQFFILQQQAEELLTELSRQDMDLGLLTDQEIFMEKQWESSFGSKITSQPCFDYSRIYLSTGREIFAIDKDTSEIIWNKEFSSEVEVLRLVDANRALVALADGHLICVQRENGHEVWKKAEVIKEIHDTHNSLSQISLNQYRQLEDSVLLICQGNNVTLTRVRTGEEAAQYRNSDPIDYISDYDLLDRCIYLVSGKKIKKIKINVVIL